MIHFQNVLTHHLSIRATGQQKVQRNAGPNTNPTASVCKSNGEISTRFPLGRLVELKTSGFQLFSVFHYLVYHVIDMFLWCIEHVVCEVM
mgnify:CR=1 FL=1